MPGTANEYTCAWDKGLSKAPKALCVEHPMLHHAILRNLKPNLMRMVDMSQCTTIQTCFQEIELAKAKTFAARSSETASHAKAKELGHGVQGKRTGFGPGAAAKKPRNTSNVCLAAAQSSDKSSLGKAWGY